MLRTVLLIILSLVSVRSEIREFNGLIDANSDVIHYSQGFLIAPGFIDLSGLTFTTQADVKGRDYDPEMRDPSDETAGDSETDDDKVDPGEADTNPSKGGGRHRLAVASYVRICIMLWNRDFGMLRTNNSLLL